MLSRPSLREAIASGELFIEGLKEESIQPASIDLHLGNHFISAIEAYESMLDPFDRESVEAFFTAPQFIPDTGIPIGPQEFVLAATERVRLGNSLVAQVAGKSSVARYGLMIESAGFIDPGFDGCITLEIYNQMPFSVLLVPGQPICQLAVSRLDAPADVGYAGKYQGADGPQASRHYLNKRPGERA